MGQRSPAKRLIQAAIGLVLCTVGQAFSSFAQADDIQVGKTLATLGNQHGAAACASCHGAAAQGNAAAGFPRLAAVSAAYISEQLAAFAQGTRQNPIMQPIAKALSARERNAVARYFSTLPPPAGIQPEDSPAIQPSDTGAWLATRGRWQTGLPACAQCHGPGGVGVGTAFPPLARQPALYIANQLHSWQQGTRAPGPMALMPVVAKKLSATDIAAVAAYYAALGTTPAGMAQSGGKQ